MSQPSTGSFSGRNEINYHCTLSWKGIVVLPCQDAEIMQEKWSWLWLLKKVTLATAAVKFLKMWVS
jgi:hypothetical protein